MFSVKSSWCCTSGLKKVSDWKKVLKKIRRVERIKTIGNYQTVVQILWTIPDAVMAMPKQRITSGKSFIWKPLPKRADSKFPTA